MTYKIIKKITIQVLKLLIAFGLVVYMIYTDKLNLKAIYQTKSNINLLLLTFFCLLAANFINFYRWNLLLKGQNIFLKAREVISLCFIGLFFTTVLPGAVGGDLVKSLYIAKRTPEKKTAAVMTVLLDRVVGLIALIIVACTGLIINFKIFISKPALRNLGIFVFIVLIGFSIFFALGLSRRVYKNKYLKLIFKKLPLSVFLRKIYTAFHAYRNNHRALTFSILISFMTHSFNIYAFYIAAKALGFNSLDFFSFMFIVPIGLITSAIPLAPAGIGIGQAAFLKLFEWSLGYKTTIGADAITIWQLISIVIFLFGGFFYITYKNKIVSNTDSILITNH